MNTETMQEENEKMKRAIANLKIGLQAIAKNEYDFGDAFTGDEAVYTAMVLLDNLKELDL